VRRRVTVRDGTVAAGVLRDECAALLQAFFSARR